MPAESAAVRLQRPEDLQAVASSILVPLRVTAPVDAAFPGRFRATVDSAHVGPVILAHIRGAAHQVTREADHISSTDGELLKVTLHRSGPADVFQDDRTRRARAGDLVVFDTARPYRLTVTDACDVIVIAVPRTMLGANADVISRRAAMPVPCEAGTRAVIAAFFSDLAERIDDLPGGSNLHLADALASLLVATFTDTSPQRVEVTADLTDRITAYTIANLGDPALSVESVARRHGISPRYLHRLFQRRGITFAAWVRQERLIRIRRDLQDPALATRTAAAIAARWGIPDSGHLSRALKKEFGLSAAGIRRTSPPSGNGRGADL
ncbi:helix-turn-helix domain-containing protein [Actinoallomurus liliacearum]|uniref:Helix-turn-helix domain-containing protein n=1 Tax=Actinoallomurus liliacearum TaxID=1080073 RepID=A0ABP8TFY5_9ACTN